MGLWVYPNRKKLLWGMACVAVLVCVMVLPLGQAGRLEPLVPDCPIWWASGSYGTDQRFHTLFGYPMGCPTLGDLLIRLEMRLIRWNGGRSVLGIAGTFGHNRQEEPSLVIRVLVPPQTGPPIGCHYRVTVADKGEIIATSMGCSGMRTVEEYEFRGLPVKSAKGLVVEFYPSVMDTNFSSFPTNSVVGPIARLKL